MIYLKATGRMGNQFFQYAFAKYLKRQTGQKICITFDRVRKFHKVDGDGWENALQEFHVRDYEEIFYHQIRYLPLWMKLKAVRLLIKFFDRMKCGLLHYGEPFGVICCYNPVSTWFQIRKRKNYILDGLFEYTYVVDQVLEELRQEFKTRNEAKIENENLYEMIRNTESVCVTVRKFDLEKEDYKEFYQVCDLDYFYRGIRYIGTKKKEIVLFIFSDAIEWCKENFKFETDLPEMNLKVFYESEQNSLGEKLRLMTECKNFIISNSTFSWWAQKLADYDNKIVCAPKRWNRDYATEDIGLYCKEWVLIDN